MKQYAKPLKGDGANARAILAEIVAGRLKGAKASAALRAARYADEVAGRSRP